VSQVFDPERWDSKQLEQRLLAWPGEMYW